LATFKHISSKNADYGAAEQYLTFEHDEFTMKPTLDENGRLISRDDYRISSLNCGGEDFAIACMRSNLKYGKNQKREDVKSHHYIISFDPRDAADNGLTVDRAQELGEEFCKTHFPGHQALVCTHPDGHNHSGNIHVHIVINSLRIAEVPLLPYMERPADTREGCKHRCTDAATELPSVSIGRNGKDKPHWIKRTLPLPPQVSRPNLRNLKPTRRSYGARSAPPCPLPFPLRTFPGSCYNRA